jgi:hypothetical protein
MKEIQEQGEKNENINQTVVKFTAEPVMYMIIVVDSLSNKLYTLFTCNYLVSTISTIWVLLISTVLLGKPMPLSVTIW